MKEDTIGWQPKPKEQRAASVQIRKCSEKKPVSLIIPGSKSLTNRALLLAAVAEGPSIIREPLIADDTYWMIETLKLLGADISTNDGCLQITPGAHLEADYLADSVYIGSAGTTARFLPGLIAAKGSATITLTASEQLSQRPTEELVAGLRQLGANIKLGEQNYSFPMAVAGGTLAGGDATIDCSVSSQYASGMLMAAPLAQNPVTLRLTGPSVQEDYIQLTLDMMRSFGVKVAASGSLEAFKVDPQSYIGRDITIEADASTATYFFALAAATGRCVTVLNITAQTKQPDIEFLDILQQMGCVVEKAEDRTSVTGPAQLRGGFTFDLTRCSDSAAALAAICPLADGEITIVGIEHIRKHESDRVKVLAENLSYFGVPVKEHADGLTVNPVVEVVANPTIPTHDDHRIAMGFSVLATALDGAVILDPDCVAKTCPNFYTLLQVCSVPLEVL